MQAVKAADKAGTGRTGDFRWCPKLAFHEL